MLAMCFENLGRWVEDAVSSLYWSLLMTSSIVHTFSLARYVAYRTNSVSFVSFSSQHIVACHFSQLIYFATLQLPDDMEKEASFDLGRILVCHLSQRIHSDTKKEAGGC
jgi:hypothetical protein